MGKGNKTSTIGIIGGGVAGLTAALEAAGDVVGQRKTPLHDLVPMTLEIRRFGFKTGQLSKHVGNIGVFVRTRRRTTDSSRCHLAEPARRVVRVTPKTRWPPGPLPS